MKRQGFTILELVIVMGILAVLLAITIVAINPGRQLALARDAQRKSDIRSIRDALLQYYIDNKAYPGEILCDSSIGSSILACPVNPPQSGWSVSSAIVVGLVQGGYIAALPVDPINNAEYYYKYEPRNGSQTPCTGTPCRYWIAARLESPANPSRPIYRCTDWLEQFKGACEEIPFSEEWD